MTNILSLTKPVTKNLLGIAQETLFKWYDEMLLIRRFEEKCAQLYGMGKIGGFCHLYNGQEAIAAGSIGAITRRINVYHCISRSWACYFQRSRSAPDFLRSFSANKPEQQKAKAVPCICSTARRTFLAPCNCRWTHSYRNRRCICKQIPR